ncbi:MAG TPA: hypothetical protein VKG45_11220 [Actinomycetes bacterium]|nr:hypothetical protein [Actinomycetes bacterium]
MGRSWVRLPVVRAAAGAVAAALLLLPAAGTAASAAAPPRARAPRAPVVLLLVRSWSWAQARPLAAAAGRPVTVGLVSTLPPDASLASRVLSLGAGRRVDARALTAGTSPAAVARLRGDNPDAELGGLPPVRVLADPDLERAGVLGLAGPAGTGPARAEPLDPLPPDAAAAARTGLLVVAVGGAGRAAEVLPRLPRDARVLLVGLEPAPGRARTAPYVEIGRGPGLASSAGTRRDGLVALEDVRAGLLAATGADGGPDPVRALDEPHPLDAVDRLDRRVGALVAGRTWAIPLLALVALAAGAALLPARTRPGARRAARALLLLTMALPAGYLVASAVAPGSAPAWLGLGAALAVALATAAGRARDAAPAVLGAVLLALVAADLLAGGEALARPLLGGSAYDGERFYGLGNGYFACALAAAVLVIAYRPVPRGWAVALFGALAVVDGLPWLGADVGGALTAMVTAAAAWALLGDRPPRPARLALLAAAALAAGAAVAFGGALLAGAGGTHADRFVDLVARDGPAAAARVFAHKLEVDARLLLATPFGWVGPVVTAGVLAVALRGWPLLGPVPERPRRAVLVGVAGSAALILLNDTGVTAAAASGLLLAAVLAWAVMPGDRSPATGGGPGRGRVPRPAAAARRLDRGARHAGWTVDAGAPQRGGRQRG